MRRTDATQSQDDGFTLVEVVVAAFVLGIGAVLSLTLVLTGLGTVKGTTQRSAAAALAAAQIEKVQGLPVTAIPDGRTTAPTRTVDGTAFTITQDASYLPLGAGASSCTTNGALAYKDVTVTVTWPDMGTTQPVTSSTLRALGLGDTTLASQGSAAVKVNTSGGAGVPDTTVALTSSTGAVNSLTTGSDGCVVFAGLGTGNYTAAVDRAGYVGPDSQQATSQVVGVTAGAMTSAQLTIDVPGALAVAPSAQAGAVVPLLQVSLQNPALWGSSGGVLQLDTCGQPLCLTGSAGSTTRTIASLYPGVGTYQAWVGTCSDAAPSTLPSGSVTSSTTTTLAVPTATVTVTAGTGTGQQELYAVHAQGDATCPSGEVYDLGRLPAPGASEPVALPLGRWALQLSSSPSSLVSAQTVTTTSTAPTASVTVTS